MEKRESIASSEQKGSFLSLRRVTAYEVDDYLALERSLPASETYSGIDIKEEALQEIAENEVYFLYKEGELVGSVAFQLKAPDHAYISGIVVSPEFQGQGIGKEAVRLILEKLKDIERVDLVTHPKNERARELYESFGFKQVGEEIEDYFGDGQPRIVMVLER